MKALPSIAFSEFRGTASEVTARQVRGRTVLSGRAQHSHVKPPKQSLRRANFGFITKQFRTLTDGQRREWETLAAAHREKALIGDGAPLTGHNLFVCLNANRALLGIPLTKDAPANIHGSHYIAYEDIWITPEKLIIYGLKGPDYPDSRLVVKMASTDSSAVTKAWGKTVITGTFRSSDWGDIDLTEIYTEQFGIPVITGHKYFFEMYWIDENSGYVSEITRVCFPATESLSIHGKEYIPRQRVTQTDLSDNPDNCVTALNVEFTSGTPVASFSGTLEGYPGVAVSYAYLNEDADIPYAGTAVSSFVLVRGSESLAPQVFGVTINKSVRPWDDGITFAYRSGKYTKPSELIGSAPLIRQ